MLKKLLILLFVFIPLNSYALEKQTTFNKDLFKQAQSDGKVCLLYTSPSPRD